MAYDHSFSISVEPSIDGYTAHVSRDDGWQAQECDVELGYLMDRVTDWVLDHE